MHGQADCPANIRPSSCASINTYCHVPGLPVSQSQVPKYQQYTMLEHISSNTQNWMHLILLNISLSKYKQKQMILQGLHG